MKKINYLLILSFALLAGCSASEIDYNLIQDRSGIAYLPNEPEPFTGTAVASYPSGQQQIVVSYENGKPTGISSEWYANGQMKTEQHFSGEEIGRIRDWYENGEVARDIKILNGTLVGKNIWKSPEFEGEMNVSNGLLDGVLIYNIPSAYFNQNHEKGLLIQQTNSWKNEASEESKEARYEHRKDGSKARYTFFKRRYEYRSEYSHIIEEAELDRSKGQIITKTFEKGKDDQEFSTDSKKESNDWEDTSPIKVSVTSRNGRVSLEFHERIENLSLKTGKLDGRLWQYNEKSVTSEPYNHDILNGWVISFDREKAAWDDVPNCYIAGDWENEAEKCEIAFGKSKKPDDSIIPERFKTLIDQDKKKVSEALIENVKAEKERRRKAEIEKKQQEEAERKRRIKAEKKRKAEEEKQRLINSKKTEKEKLFAEQKQVKPEITKKIKYKNVTTKQGKDKPESAQYIPVYVPQPQYPRRAQTRGKEGYAVILVTVTTTGGVRDPVMIEEFPEGWGFGRAAVKAANKLKYNPFVIDGQAQEMSGVMYKFTFQMAR